MPGACESFMPGVWESSMPGAWDSSVPGVHFEVTHPVSSCLEVPRSHTRMEEGSFQGGKVTSDLHFCVF